MNKRISFKSLNGINLRAEGLSNEEAQLQRNRFGANNIVEVVNRSWWDIVRNTLKDPMIWFLIVVGAVFFITGEPTEGKILFLAIIPLLFMDAVLHQLVQASTATLKSRLATIAKILRNSQEITVNSQEIVPGDLVVIKAGDYLAADGYFEKTNELQIDESALTGEAMPIFKKAFDSSQVLNFLGRDNVDICGDCLGFAGTRVLTGDGYLRIFGTGKHTFYGEIVQSVTSIQQERTPLQISVARLVRQLILAAAVFCLILAGVRIYNGYGWIDAFLTSATLAIAAIPEEFPVVFTFFLGIGVYRLAKKKALVRRGVSVENIGRVTAICTDKTGTLTLGRLKLAHFQPSAELNDDELLKVAAAASRPLNSDPIDQAIWESAKEKKLTIPEAVQVFPFTEGRRFETAFAFGFDGQPYCYMKGAPETVLNKSNLKQQDIQWWLEKTSSFAKAGHKVLACASQYLTKQQLDAKIEPEKNFTLAGLLVFEDPPREKVRESIQYCYENGIKIWMITGDHPETAVAVAKEIGLGGESPVGISAEREFHKLEESYLKKNRDFIYNVQVIARCDPIQKLQIVNSLRHFGELVAVTGDGVNDVPALKASDIGIAMGESGTRSAREVSSIILMDDNFNTIVNAIKEGQRLFISLKMSFEYLLLIHIPFVLTAALIPLMGYPLIYLPIHIVWMELIIHPTALFAFLQNTDPMPRTKSNLYRTKPNKTIFSLAENLRIIFIGFALTLTIIISYISNFKQSANESHARAHALALLIFWNVALIIYLTGLKNKAALFISTIVVVSTLLIIQTGFIAKIFHLSPLALKDFFMILTTLFIFVAVFKIVRSRFSEANYRNME